MVFVGAYETIGTAHQKHVLEKDEYIKVLDSKTGVTRVEKGPGVLVLQPTDAAMMARRNDCYDLEAQMPSWKQGPLENRPAP